MMGPHCALHQACQHSYILFWNQVYVVDGTQSMHATSLWPPGFWNHMAASAANKCLAAEAKAQAGCRSTTGQDTKAKGGGCCGILP